MKLHRGRQNVTLWLKPEHVEALERLAAVEKMNLSPWLIYRVADSIALTNGDPEGELAEELISDVAARQHRVPAQFDI